MKFAICNETFQDWPFEKAFEYARSLGYTGLEIAPFTIATDVRTISAAKRAEVKKQAESAGLEIIGLHWLLAKTTSGFYLTSPDKDVRAKTGEYLGDLARFCRDLGGDVMVLGSPLQRNLLPGVTHDEAMKYAADTIIPVMKIFDECGVTLALEPLGPEEGDFLRTADLGAELMDLVALPRCQLHLDVKAMSTMGQPVTEIIKKHFARMAHFHANDPNKRGPGMGQVDFVPIMRTLLDLNYTGWVSVEVFDYTPGIEALASESIRNLKEAIAKAKG